MLAQLKEPLVQLRGRWVDVRPGPDRARAGVHPEAPERPRDAAGRGAVHGAGADHPRRRARSPRSRRAAGSTRLLEDIRQGARAEEVPADARRLSRHPAPLPAARRGLAGHPPALQPGRPAGRRHGAGQNAHSDCAAAARAERSRADARHLSDLGGRQLAARARRGLRLGCACWCTTARSGLGAGAAAAAAQHDVVLSTYSLLHRDEAVPHAREVGRAGPGRGAEHQERLDAGGAGGAGHRRALARGADRHAGREPPGRPVEHLPGHQPRLPRVGRGVPTRVRAAHRARLGRRRDRRV